MDTFEKGKNRVKLLGLEISSIFTLLLIVLIIFTGFDYDQTLQGFQKSSPFRVIAPLEIGLVCFAFIATGLSFPAFSVASETKAFLILVLIVSSLSALLTLCISIFCLISGSIGDFEDYIGCQTKYKGFFKQWEAMDRLLALADQATCSKECQCVVSPYTKKMFEDDPIAGPVFKYFYNTRTVNSTEVNNQDAITSFKQCQGVNLVNSKKNEILTEFKGKMVFHNFDSFHHFWLRIEQKFDCVGWCAISAPVDKDLIEPECDDDSTNCNENIPYQMPFVKYIFSNINRGLPRYRGCMNILMKYMVRILTTFGIIGLISGVLQLFLLVLILKLLMLPTDKDIAYNKRKEQVKEENDDDDDD